MISVLDKHFSKVAAIVFFVLACIIYFAVYQHFPVHYLNDTGVELLQVKDFQPWPFKTFIATYQGGGVDEIEAFYGYYMAPFLAVLGDEVSVFRVALGLFFAASAAVFFVLANRLFGRTVALCVALLYLTSPYTIWWAVLLLRNAFTPLFMMGALWGMIDILKGHARRGFVLTAGVAFVGVFVYSSLKTVLPMLLLACALTALLLRDWRALKVVTAAGLSAMLMVLLAAWLSGSLNELLFRGKWMLGLSEFGQEKTFSSYVHMYVRTWLLPVYESPEGFLAEPTHNQFARSILPAGALWGLWALGLLTVIYKGFNKDKLALFILLALFLNPVILCMAGPSLKTNLCLAPILFVVIGYGIQTLSLKMNHRLLAVLLIVFAGYNFYQESRFMLVDVVNRSKDNVENAGQDVAQYLAKHDREFDVVLFSSMGIDLARLYYPQWKEKSVWMYETSEFVIPEVEKQLKQNKKVWVIMSKDTPNYKALEQRYGFCYAESVRLFNDVLKPCADVKK